MNEITSYAVVVLVGFVVGIVFFGGLWWTVLKGIVAQSPGAWFFVSLVLRTVIAVAGFYYIARGSWQRVLLCLAGFVVARIAIALIMRRSARAIHAS